ncbi:tonoplast monosaccharide transporter2 [Hibiscus trionum]|uniref:Tonoplast monosaccharide transporter2 n=1 Tax=Hibiscus trionum TaxID=183268 RepID=A0A9W7LS34_HIBTR|nr:tonoplast monosaccharide transporter2 [Hibiscus trionum]
MMGAVLVALTASIGNLLQGWDSATIAGANMYIKKEFKLESQPTLEGLIVAMSLIGATCVTMCSGSLADWLGRRALLIISSVLYFSSSIIMLWSPNVSILLMARLLDGIGLGLAVTLVPIYISETAPPEIRGLLNTLPLFSGTVGMFLSYCMVFGMSFSASPDWRLMLGILSVPSLVYFLLTVFYMPESPRWLVSKGRMSEAKKALQMIRGREDVSGEMALLVEGLGVGGETSIEEYIISPVNRDSRLPDISAEKDRIKLYGTEEGLSWTARPVPAGQKSFGFGVVSHQASVQKSSFRPGLVSQQASIAQTPLAYVDPLVTLFGSVHEKYSEVGSVHRSTLFPFVSSMSGLVSQPVVNQQVRNEESDEESVMRESDDEQSDDSDDNLRTPLISRQTSVDKDIAPVAQESVASMRNQSLMPANVGESMSTTGIGGGWQLAWKWSEREGRDGRRETSCQRIYMHEGSTTGFRQKSVMSQTGADVLGDVHAAALVSQSALSSRDLMKNHPVGPAMVHPAETAQGSIWNDLFEPGVKHALVVGVGIEMLQQFSGLSSVLYYIPQILDLAGVGVLGSKIGMSSYSASLLVSLITALLMLPCITVVMRFVDVAGRRFLLLLTVPVLALSLLMLVFGGVIGMGSVLHAAISTSSVVLSCCFYVMGLGPVPGILCAEIFPTRVRGICIAICSLVYWISSIIVAYSLPVLLRTVGLTGVFAMYATVCIAAWVFVFLKVPETKGMPLEVITEFFAVGSKQVKN